MQAESHLQVRLLLIIFEEAEEANLSANYTYYAIGKPTFEKIKQFGYKAEMANEQTIDGLLNIIKESRNHK